MVTLSTRKGGIVGFPPTGSLGVAASASERERDSMRLLSFRPVIRSPVKSCVDGELSPAVSE